MQSASKCRSRPYSVDYAMAREARAGGGSGDHKEEASALKQSANPPLSSMDGSIGVRGGSFLCEGSVFLEQPPIAIHD